jgi:hypothetical protein
MASIKEKPQYFETRIQSPFERKSLNQNKEINKIKDSSSKITSALQ